MGRLKLINLGECVFISQFRLEYFPETGAEWKELNCIGLTSPCPRDKQALFLVFLPLQFLWCASINWFSFSRRWTRKPIAKTKYFGQTCKLLLLLQCQLSRMDTYYLRQCPNSYGNVNDMTELYILFLQRPYYHVYLYHIWSTRTGKSNIL